MHALKNSARAGADVVSPYRTMLLAWLRGMLAALLITLIILLLAPIAASSAYATTESSDVQANAPPAIAQTIATAETNAVASGDSSSEATVASTDSFSDANETTSDLHESKNEQVDSNPSDPTGITVDDSLANTNQSIDIPTGAGNDSGAPSNMGDSGYIPAVNPVITDTANTAITPVTDSIAITADDLNNAVGCDYQGVATDLENANQSLALATDASSTSLDSRGEGNAGNKSPVTAESPPLSFSASNVESDELSTAKMGDPITVYFLDTFSDVTTAVGYFGTGYTGDPSTLSDKTYGLATDPIFDASGNYVCNANGTDTLYSNVIPKYYRYGYSLVCYLICWQRPNGTWAASSVSFAGSNPTATLTTTTGYTGTTMKNHRLYAIWTDDPTGYATEFQFLDMTSQEGEGGLHWDSVINIPAGYNPANFAGWYVKEDTTYSGGSYHPDSSSTEVDGTKKLGELMCSVFNLASVKYNTTSFNNTITKINIYACTPSGSSVTFNVVYEHGIASSDPGYGATAGTDPYNPSDNSLKNLTSHSALSPTGGPLNYTATGRVFNKWKVTSTDLKDTNGNSIASILISPGESFTTKVTIVDGATYTFTGQWDEVDYDVKWYLRYGGTYGASLPNYDTNTVKWSNFLTMPTSLSTADYTDGGITYEFKGWYLDQSGSLWTSATAGSYMVTSGTDRLKDITGLPNVTPSNGTTKGTVILHAVWEAKSTKYKITYHNYNNTGNSATTDQYVYYKTADGNNYNEAACTSAALYLNPTVTYYTFGGWANSAANAAAGIADSSVTPGDPITGVNTGKDFYAIWTGKPVNITYNPNSGGESVTVTPVGGTATAITTPTMLDSATVGTAKTLAAAKRTGYTFKGWAETASASTTLTSWTPTSDTAKTFYAIWEQNKYSVIYDGNGGKINGVPSYTDTNTYTWDQAGFVSAVSGLPKTYTVGTHSNMGTFIGWAKTSTATAEDVFTYSKISDVAASDTVNPIKIYAVWKHSEITVTYTSESTSKGSVSPSSQTVDLVTGYVVGTSTAPSSTATATTYYVVKDWTTPTGVAVTGGAPSSTTLTTHTFYPDMDELRSAYDTAAAGGSATSVTFAYQANFTDRSYKYKVEVYAQQANGSYNSTPTTTLTSYGGKDFTAKRTTSVSMGKTDYEASDGTTSLQNLYLLKNSYPGTSVTNSYLYEYDSSAAGRVETISSISDVEASNVLKLYYKRKTFNVNDTWGSVVPSDMVGKAGDYLPSPNTGILWGDTVTMGSPSSTGYTFAWSVTTPSSGVGMSGNTFTLNAQNMADLAAAGTSTVMVTGTWTKNTYGVTLMNTSSGIDAAAGLALPSPNTKTVDYGDTLGSWVPTPSDQPTYTYYFTGWKRVTNTGADYIDPVTLSTVTYTSANLQTLPITEAMYFVATWEEKIVITYMPGANDSSGSPIATWTQIDKKLGSENISANQIGTYTSPAGISAKFDGSTDTSGNPAAKTGWTFAGWKVTSVGTPKDGTTPSVSVGPNPLSQADVDNVYLKQSITFTAQWDPTDWDLTYAGTGIVKNNTSNTDALTLTSGTGTSKVATDATLTLPSSVSFTSTAATNNGFNASDAYTFVGWNTDPNYGSGTFYAIGATPRMPASDLTLYPVFEEKTATIKYKLAQTTMTGGISPSTDDTVYVVTHNGVNPHTASVSTPAGYEFTGWTKGAAYSSTNLYLGASDGVSGATITPVFAAGSLLTAGSTIEYYANFKAKTFTVKINGATNGTVTVNGSSSNEIKVDYGGSVKASDISAITPDTGYELTGWTTNDPLVPTLSGNASNEQGLYTYVVKDDVELTPVFSPKVSNDYTVNYYFDGGSHAGPTSQNVAWQGTVFPTTGTDATPSKAGYDFKGWYADPAFDNGSKLSATTTFENLYDMATRAINPYGDATVNTTTGKGTATIYAKWEEKKTYTVVFDQYGSHAQNAAWSGDTVTAISPIINLSWTSVAGTTPFDVPTPTRDGYTFNGWTASIDTNSDNTPDTQTHSTPYLTASNASSYTYGSLANGHDADTLYLIAVWTPNTYTVTYVYNNANTPSTATHTVNVTWIQSENFYQDFDNSHSIPVRNNYKFDGWMLSYSGNEVSKTAVIDANQTIAQILGGDATATNIELKATWIQELNYIFQDVIKHSDGTTTTHNFDPIPALDNETITLSTSTDYGTPGSGDHHYIGYVFDSDSTDATFTVTSGNANIYKVYYKPRVYDIHYFDYSDKTTVLCGSDGRTGTSQVVGSAAWDSTAITPNPALTLPAGVDRIDWYYEDPANPGTYIKVTGSTTVSTVLGTGGENDAFVKLYADYVAAGVDVQFAVNDSNYATLSGSTSQRVSADAAANAVSSVTANAKPGYEFVGWYYIVNPASGYTPVATDFTNGTLTAVSSTEGTVTNTPGTASATDSSTIQALKFPASGPWQNILYVARFSPKTYTFTLDGGSSDAVVPTTSGATGGKEWTDSFVIGEPTRPGYSFAGWESSALPGSSTKFDGTSTYTTDQLADAVGYNTNITLTAKWDAVQYRIYYYDDDFATRLSDVNTREDATWNGTGLEPKDTSGNVATPAKLGFTFMGWDTDGDGNVDLTSTTDYSTVAALANQNVTSAQYIGSAGDSTSKYGIKLYAVWNERNDYNVTFDPGNGVSATDVSNMPGDLSGLTWSTNTIDAHAPSRDGYRFVDWTVLNATVTPNAIIKTGEAAGTGKVYSVLAGGSDDSITTVKLQATWAPVTYRIYYYDNDQSTLFPGLTRTDAVWDDPGLAANSNPTKAGYTFTGWSTTGGSGATADLDNTTTKYSDVAVLPNQGVTSAEYVGSANDTTNPNGIKLYATWQANAAFKIEVHYEDASGNDAGIIPIPVREGFNDTVYYTYNDVTMNVSVDPTTSKVNITPTNVTADGADPIPASLNMPNAYASGYEYDATKTLAGLSMLTRTLDASVNDADNPYVFKIYYKAKGGYTLFYDPNGGEYAGGSTAPLQRTPVTWLTDDLGNYAAAAPTKEGYKLGGWTTTFNGNNSYEVVSSDTYGKFAANDSTSTKVTLYAKWVEREYNINYVDINPSDPTDIRVVMSSQNISVSDKNVDPYKWEDNVSLTAPDVSKTYHGSGWKWLGWSTVADPTVDNKTIYTSALYSTLATAQGVGTTDDTESGHAGVTLYAVWAKYVPYSIEYYKPSATVSGTYDLIYNDKTTHDENNPGVEGEDTWLTETEINAHRPPGYKHTTTSDSVEKMPLTSTASANVFKVYYEINNDFTIIFDYDGGSASGETTSSEADGLTWFDTPSTPSSGFTRNGYKFSGEWYTEREGKGTKFVSQEYGALAGIQGKTDLDALYYPVTLYAMWTEISEYVINYDINNKKNKVGDDTTNPHVITGMSDDKNPVTPDDLENLSWTGALSGLADGNAMDAEPIGYHFGSWNTERNGSGLEVTSATTYEELSNRVRPNGASTEPITLYAQWEEDEVEITYMPDGSGGTVTRSIDKISAVTGTAIGAGSSSGQQLTSVAVANPGWHFVRWRLVDGTNADPVAAAAELAAMAAVSGVNTTSVSGQKLSVGPSSDDNILHAATYIAEFEQNDPATLIYNPNGGTGSIDSVTEPYGTILTLADGTEYKRKYYTITGWNTKADGSGTPYALGYSSFELPEGTTTLYAQWTKNKYPVTIETSTGGGGTVTGTSEDVEYGSTPTDTFTTSANPTPDSGYIFTGWTYTMTDAETGEVTTGTIKDLSELKISGPVSLTAVFEKDPNAVTETETESGSGSSSGSGTATTTPSGTNGNDGSSYSGGATYYGADTVKTGDAGTSTSGFAFAAIAAILLALLVARRRRDDEDDYASTVCSDAYTGVMKRGTQKIAVGFAVMLACLAVSTICAQNALASESADDEQVVIAAAQEIEENTQVEAVITVAAETEETVLSTAEAQEPAGPSEKTDDAEETTDEQGKENESADKKDKKGKEEETQNNEAAVNADQTPAAAGQQEENGKDEVQPEQVQTEDETAYVTDDEQDEMPAQESEVPENDAAATMSIASTFETVSTAAAFNQIDPDTYYLTGVNPAFGEYFVLDSSSGYLSLVEQTSSMGPPQQWVITLESTDTQGNLYRISSASNLYLIASTNGIASISSTASTDLTAYWRAVVSTLNGQPVVALYNAATFNGSQRALALVAEKDSSGTSTTLTVELLSCGSKSFPDIPDLSWLWYYRTANPLDWTITYSDTYGASGSTPITTVTGGQPATVAGNGFSRPGYNFVSWNTKPNGSGTSYVAGATINYVSYNDGYVLPLYAQWKEATATVTYAASTGGKVGLGTSGSASSNSVSETVGAATGVLTGTSSATFSGASAKASTGYHFGGWSSNGTNAIDSTTASSTTITPTTVVRLTNYADSGSSVAIYHGVTVTANFDANTYTVAYDANGGTGTLSASSVTYGNNDTLSTASSTLSQEGYSFSGWNTKADGSGISVSDGATLSTSTLNQLISTNALTDTNGASTTLYAQWTADPTPVTPDPPTPDPSETTEAVVAPIVVPTPAAEPTTSYDEDGYSSGTGTIPVVETIAQAVEAVAQPALEVTAATAETLVTVGTTLADTIGSAADSSTSFVDALTNLTPAEAAQAATTTVTAVAAVSTVAGLVGAGASIAGAIAGAGAIGAGAAGAVGAASAADLTAELAAESTLAGGFFVRLRRRIKALLGMDEQEEEDEEE